MRDDICKIVKKYKKKYNTKDPYTLVDELNIILIIAPLNTIYGMYKYQNKNKVIYLNECLSEFERKYVLAHELGHAILHPKVSCSFFTNNSLVNKIKKEYEANLFAAELLIDFNESDLIYLEGYSINQLASKYEVPTSLMNFKINSLKSNQPYFS